MGAGSALHWCVNGSMRGLCKALWSAIKVLEQEWCRIRVNIQCTCIFYCKSCSGDWWNVAVWVFKYIFTICTNYITKVNWKTWCWTGTEYNLNLQRQKSVWNSWVLTASYFIYFPRFFSHSHSQVHANHLRQASTFPQHCLQVSDPSLPDSGGDGLHSRADGVQQVGQLTCAMGLPALFQNKPGEGQNVGVEGSFVRHLAVRRGTGTLCVKWYNVSRDLQLKSELQSQDKGVWEPVDQSKVPFLMDRWTVGSAAALAVGLKSKVQR